MVFRFLCKVLYSFNEISYVYYIEVNLLNKNYQSVFNFFFIVKYFKIKYSVSYSLQCIFNLSIEVGWN